MDSNAMLKILRPVFNSFTPLEFEIVGQFKNAFDVKIVSEKFVGVDPGERVKMLSEKLNSIEPQISFDYDISFVALTPNESSGSVQGFEDSNFLSQNKPHKIASKEY